MKEKIMIDYRYKKSANKYIKNINEKKFAALTAMSIENWKTLKYMFSMKY